MATTTTEPSPAGRSAALAVELVGLELSYGGAGAPLVLQGVDLHIEPGEVVVLLGPSGCGKTSLLRVVAGLERPSAGRVVVGGRELSGPDAWVRPEHRDVGMVFQDWALFTHLDVAANVGFSLPQGQRRSSPMVTRTLDLVGLAGLEGRMPATLSGGQQQRVALGRALAQRPSVLLCDEPFSNLDAGLRERVRGEVRELLAQVGVTTLLVTHDRAEAFALGDRVAVMRDGRVLQCDTPPNIYAEPVDRWVAGFVGDLVEVPATAAGTQAHTPLGDVDLRAPWGGDASRGEVTVGLRPEQLELLDADSERGAAATVTDVEFLGPWTRVTLDIGPLAVDLTHPGVPRCAVHDRVRVGVRPGTVAVHVAPR